MFSFRKEPFLWLHLAGIGLYPLACGLVWLALAIATPYRFYGLELLVLALVGIGPILWMQWQRPFEIFSLLIVSIRPESLTLQQRRILALFKRPRQRGLALLGALLMGLKLAALYYFAPLASMAVSDLPQIRLLGLTVAALAFLVANLFLQVPLSVLGVLLTSVSEFEQQTAIEPEEIRQLFTVPGFPLTQIALIPSVEV